MKFWVLIVRECWKRLGRAMLRANLLTQVPGTRGLRRFGNALDAFSFE
jgi:hypothetical protein